MLYIYRSSVKDGQLRNLQKWLKENSKEVDNALPKSWNLKGVYFPVLGFGDKLFEIHWELDGYEALAEAGNSGKTGSAHFRDSPVAKLYSFLDVRSHDARLLKDARDKETVLFSD